MTTQTQQSKDNVANNGKATGGDDFVDIQFNRPSFKLELLTKRDDKDPEKEVYTGQPIQAKLTALVDLGEVEDQETGELRQQSAYVLKMEKPNVAYDRDSNRIDVAIGDEVFLWRTAQLDQAIAAAAGMSVADAANHPTHLLRLRITPLYRAPFESKALAKRGVTKGRMWHFKVQADPKPVPRQGNTALGILAAAAAQPKQIGSAS